ncbi:Putative protein of unknown function [Podospora comata]|uniref:Uncharacterized protein n=1 Tax=Podospora comata TaxID=48703 RepID=A0ABY6S3P8_PODCO|nr:Putative protein of unknown function [Podospora comata]
MATTSMDYENANGDRFDTRLLATNETAVLLLAATMATSRVAAPCRPTVTTAPRLKVITTPRRVKMVPSILAPTSSSPASILVSRRPRLPVCSRSMARSRSARS